MSTDLKVIWGANSSLAFWNHVSTDIISYERICTQNDRSYIFSASQLLSTTDNEQQRDTEMYPTKCHFHCSFGYFFIFFLYPLQTAPV
ncbi:hypothetical protein L5515_011580 [Caenorhabditis briggsae]|uniref:Uncharacterized protein n=1 Tax=Caenorhabditis briggsae TaxID=6238 RepID=A0AAE9EUN6_CAEBR|nr:hypothetical protein L5515_011580 [Caenorhabditis briggsae]